MNQSSIVRSEVIETGFGFYSDDELKALSVCHITSPLARDALGNPLNGGLCDERLGPINFNSNCLTCGQSYYNCPGHPGHVELDVPVYHPLLFASMYLLLKSKCAYCHRLKASSAKTRHALIKLKLLDMGDVTNALSLDDTVQPLILEDKERTHMYDVEKQLKIYEDLYHSYSLNNKSKRVDTYCKVLQQQIIDTFLKMNSALKKCENCQARSPAYRKDGYSKIFQRPLGKRVKNDKRHLKSALEEIANETSPNFEEENIEDSDSDMEVEDAIKKSDKYLVPFEVEAQIKLLWRNNSEFLDFVWNRSFNLSSNSIKINGWKIFFVYTILVPPNRFRPVAKTLNGTVAEHPQNIHLMNIIRTNESIRKIQHEINLKKSNQLASQTNEAQENDIEAENPDIYQTNDDFSKLMKSWIELQNAVNVYIDSSKERNSKSIGLRQLLERKEGLFRMNMMGKRVNYCCRSVISPDPYIATNEIGIPVSFAKVLHYPVPVNDFNVKYLRTLVERGPNEYPGANQIETFDGRVIKLDKLSLQERKSKAKLLQSNPGNKVYRHLIDGDTVLMNRQPTLHKPGIMAHRARILKHVKEHTLRLHYANCNAYNADFDGDEMNCHFVQDDLSRAEANFICNTDNQYIVPTSGNPLRGLIQDHVASAVKMTSKDTFLTKSEFQQLVFISVHGLQGNEISTNLDDIYVPNPTILKPKQLWTGKQVITAMLNNLCKPPLPPLHLDSKTRTPCSVVFGNDTDEGLVTIRYNDLLTGVLDKAAIGNSSLGLVHAVYELYGPEFAGKLLSAFGRLFTYYLQDCGHSCGIDDLVLTLKCDAERKQLLNKVENEAIIGLYNQYHTTNIIQQKVNSRIIDECKIKVIESLSQDRVEGKVKLDGIMQGIINKSASEVIKVCLPNGLSRPFLKNNFTIMVTTGAKGSQVNQSQITCFLGQQALEGQRVPYMVSGKTLPSFDKYDPTPRANGFVRDRFLTGVKPQEYYFHCMAGREGLVDTAVKTSRSGYLQRCLIKHLEDVKLSYDYTLRDSGNNIIQFLYGEDGIDPMSSSVLGNSDNQLSFLARNTLPLMHKYSLFDINSNNINKLEFNQSSKLNSLHKQCKELINEMKSYVKDNPSTDNKNIQDHDILNHILKKNSTVYLRKKINSNVNWEPKNIYKRWFIGEIINISKLKKAKLSTSSNSNSSDKLYYDIKYEDNTIVKHIPSYMLIPSIHSSNKTDSIIYGNKSKYIYYPLIKIGLPDPINSILNHGSNYGCVNEKLTNQLVNYINKNPDNLITSEVVNNVTNKAINKISKDSLEFLVNMRYMKSLAQPGEAAGCVAAQSIGEPSTQMTLNTFHLAGHGGGNVTLGIPRLREIIMTASKNQKTPLMYMEINADYKSLNEIKSKEKSYNDATNISRMLSKLTLHQLLSYEKRIEIHESISMNVTGYMVRNYKIRFNFESFQIITKTFNLTFSEIITQLKDKFVKHLVKLIRTEQKRAGDRMSHAKSLNIELFQSTSKSSSEYDYDIPSRPSASNDNDNEESNKENDEGNESKSKKNELDLILEDNDSDESDNDDDEVDEDIVGKTNNKLSLDNDENNNDELELPRINDVNDDNDNDNDDNDSDDDNNINITKIKSQILQKYSTNTRVNKTTTKNTNANSLDISNTFISSESGRYIEFTISYPTTMHRLLMLQLVEKASELTTIRQTKNIKNAYVLPIDESPLKNKPVSLLKSYDLNYNSLNQLNASHSKSYYCVQTEGVNFNAIWDLPDHIINHNTIHCNSIWDILLTYGVEAARTSIVNEVIGVFSVYGIDVNIRHLTLIADFMTNKGLYQPMNRYGMVEKPDSSLLQMSFETTCTFLVQAAQQGKVDTLESPSAQLVVGGITKVGTGCFDVMIPMNGYN